jgi:hypothetical protein
MMSTDREAVGALERALEGALGPERVLGGKAPLGKDRRYSRLFQSD